MTYFPTQIMDNFNNYFSKLFFLYCCLVKLPFDLEALLDSNKIAKQRSNHCKTQFVDECFLWRFVHVHRKIKREVADKDATSL